MEQNEENQEQIINWLNELAFSTITDKIVLLNKLKESLIHLCPYMIQECLDSILVCAMDKNVDVRRTVVTIIEDFCKSNIELLPKTLRYLIMLLDDSSVVIQKRVIQATNAIYKNAFVWICSSKNATEELEKVWDMLNQLKLHVLNMVDNENEGIRTNSIKFLEGIIILQTYTSGSNKKPEDFSLDDIPTTLSFAKKQKLEDESMHIFDLLVKYHNSEHISAVNLMACMTVLFEVAKARPVFMSKVVQAFSDLIKTLPPTLSQSQVNSVKKHMKMLTISLIRQPSSSDCNPKLVQLLTDLGLTQHEIVKAYPKDRRPKRLIDIRNGEGSAKRARIDSPQGNSQGSDSTSSDASSITESSKVTEKTVSDGLATLDNVINLVVKSMDNLPNEMPLSFKTSYEPIPKTGSLLPRPALAKLLLAVIKNEVPEKRAFAEVSTKDEDDKKSSLKNALAKLETALQENKEDFPEEAAIQTDAEKAREMDIIKNLPKDKVAGQLGSAISKLKEKVKNIKLVEVTKPLSKELKEKLIRGAVERILRSERASLETGAASQRIKMITTFAVSYGQQIRELVLAFILQDIVNQLDLALFWLFEEYSYMQGFNRSTGNLGSSKPHDKLGQNFNQLFCALITHVNDLNDPSLEIMRETLWRRIYLESPYVTDDGLQFLKHLCTQESTMVSSMKLLRDLALYHQPKAAKYVHRFLTLVTNENSSARELAIEHLTYLYQQRNESSKKAIDKFASLYLGFIALPQPPKDLFTIENDDQVAYVWNDELYKMCVQLYLSLIAVNSDLLGELWRVYVSAGADGKRCVLRHLEPSISKLGPDNPTLLALIDECPKGAETLVTKVIHILTEKNPPSEELVNRVKKLYAHKISDVRFLIPVINGLSKKEIFAALPKLIKLNPTVVREVFNKLLGISDKFSPILPVSPAELLIALHLIDPAKAELKYVIKATALCFSERQTYTSNVLGTVLQQLVEQPQLPVLLMRSVIQALTCHPTQITPLVINILQELITRQIWDNKVAWEGFLKCCQRLVPQSVSILIMLPPEQLKDALITCPDLRTCLEQSLPSMSSPPSFVANVLSELSTTSGLWPKNKKDNSFNEPLPPGMD